VATAAHGAAEAARTGRRPARPQAVKEHFGTKTNASLFSIHVNRALPRTMFRSFASRAPRAVWRRASSSRAKPAAASHGAQPAAASRGAQAAAASRGAQPARGTGEVGNTSYGIHLGGGESETTFFWRHVVPFGLWMGVSLNVAAFFSSGDEGVQILIHLDEFTVPILSPDTKRDELSERLELLVSSRGPRHRPPAVLSYLCTAGTRRSAQRLAQARAGRVTRPPLAADRHRGRHRAKVPYHGAQSRGQGARVRLRLAQGRALDP